MAIRAISQGLSYTLKTDSNFEVLFGQSIVPELIRLLASYSIQDYCVFIHLLPQGNATIINFHDGGASYNIETDEMFQTDYKKITSEFLIDREYTLYYSIDEQILCFLKER